MLEEDQKKKDAEIKRLNEDNLRLKNQKNKLLKDLKENDKLRVEDLIPTKEDDTISVKSDLNESMQMS